MEKKTYIAPEMEFVYIEQTQMLCASGDKFGVTDKETEQNADLANDRRGSWGNLWE